MKKTCLLNAALILVILFSTTKLSNAQCPQIICPSNITVNNDSGVCGAVVSFTPPVGTNPCGSGTQTFNYTGAMQIWTVPSGVTSIQVDAKGAQGGTSANPNNGNGIGGLGGRTQGTVPVTPGEVLQIYIGGVGTQGPPYPGMGGAGYNGGGNGASQFTTSWIGAGGGGASDVRRTPYALGDRLVIAGGGGGGGSNGSTPNANFGGVGGGLTAGTGGSITNLGQGGGGTQVTGGSEMDYGGFCAETGFRSGILGVGGPACNQSAGGGGGGGYYGGAGGEFGGGGGGSNYTDINVTGVTNTQGFQSGNGQVIISWTGGATTTTQTGGLPSGSLFPVGTTTQTYTATDQFSNTATCSFTITVNDNEAPIANIPVLPDVTGECTATATAPTATDNCAGAITATTSDPLSYNTQGNYSILWTYDDGAGNTTTQTQNVVIADLTAPVADVANLPDLTAECTITAIAPTATDNCAGTVTATTLDSLTYNTQGNFTITWTYEDGNGNTTTQTQNVIIADTTAPTFTCPSSFATCAGTSLAIAPTSVADNCLDTVTVTYTLTGATTASGTDDASGETFNAGVTTVTYTFDDGNGNTTNCSFEVTINTVDTTVTVNQQTLTATTSDTYQWYNCNTSAVIPGATNGSYTATVNGSYAVIVTQNGCTDTSSCHIINNVGITESSSNNNFTIYPNPATDKITITSASKEKILVSIYDVQKKLMMQTQFTNTNQIDVSKLAKGIYMVRIQSQSKELNAKLVIQ